jgi:dihydroxy-acid dehydratase
VLPRSIASYWAFENAMALDVSMGGSTNTVLHLLAAAQEAGVDFTMKTTSTASRAACPAWQGRAGNADVHMEDVHRAGGIMAILGELDRAGLLHRDLPTVHSATLGERSTSWDVCGPKTKRCAPSTGPRRAAFRPRRRSRRTVATPTLDLDRENGVIRNKARTPSARTAASPCSTATSPSDGCIVKTAGVDEHLEVHRAGAGVRKPGRCGAGILGDEVQAGDVVVIRYEGPKGGPGMQEMLYPTTYLKSKGLGKAARCSPMAASPAAPRVCRSVTPRRKRPRAGRSAGEEGDLIEIDIPNRASIWPSLRPNWRGGGQGRRPSTPARPMPRRCSPTRCIKGGVGTWGKVPMPPNPSVTPAEANKLVKWVLSQK